jgi:predicted nucleic acid-binding protein
MTDITRLVDTSIFIDYVRGNEIAKEWINRFPKGELAYSVITAAELLAGCRNRREQELLEKELTLYPMVYISGMISVTAWEWYRDLHLSHGAGFLDCLIGATAYQYGFTVCTLNDKHFNPFAGLMVERPY